MAQTISPKVCEEHRRVRYSPEGVAGTFARPIRFECIEQQYNEMVKATVVLKQGTASTGAILKRDNSYNRTHPTYKALTELGKAAKTLFLCQDLSSREIQRDVHEGLNVVENWNATNDFICYSRHGVLTINSRDQQESGDALGTVTAELPNADQHDCGRTHD